MTPSSSDSKTSYLSLGHCLLVFILVAGALLPIWVTAHFPSQNGPWYLLAAHMMHEVNSPQWNFSDYYTTSWHPIPHVLHTLLVYLFCHIAPTLVAMKLALSVYVILMPIGIYYFLSVVAPERKVLSYFAFVMIHNYTFYRGYHNFSLCIPFFFIALGYWIRNRNNLQGIRIVIMSILVACVFLAHLFGFLLLVLVIAWYRFTELKGIVKSVQSVIVSTWLGWIFFIDFFILNMRSNTWVDQSQNELLAPHTSVEYFIRKFFYTTSFPAYVIGVAAFAWIVFLIGRRLLIEHGNPHRSFIRSFLNDPFLTLTIFLIAIYFVVPWKFMSWHYISARLIPFILVFSLASVGPLPKLTGKISFQKIFVTSICIAALAIDTLMAFEVTRIDRHIQEYLSGITFFEKNKTLLPINLENPQFGQIRPLTRVYEYYHIAKGGANGKGAAYFNTLVPILYKKYPVEERFPKFGRKSSRDSINKIVDYYDYVLIWGQDGIKLEKKLEKANFRVIHKHGNLRLLKNKFSTHTAQRS